MKKHIGKLLGRLKRTHRSRVDRLRRLRMESLEGRRLLAGDISPHHNYFMAEDVNQDFIVSPLDALLIINALNEGGSRSFAEAEIESGVAHKLDTNGDNFLSPLDVLLVINRINAEGEDTPGTFISYSYELTDTSGLPLTSSVVVGETFRINVFVQDVRPPEARTITDPTDPNYSRFNGIFAAAQDLGVSDLGLVNYVNPSNFLSGIRFNDEFVNDRGVSQGGGIQIAGTQTPTVSDGQRFVLDAGSGPVTFEFDFQGTSPVATGNVAIPLRNPVPSGGGTVEPLTFNEVSAAMVTAIGGSSLGIPAVNRGAGIVGIPDSVTFSPGTTSFTRSLTNVEFLNEIKAFLDRSRSPNPDGAVPFYSVDFQAVTPGTVVFTPNGPERPGSENLVFGSQVVIPNELINFGSPFTVQIVSDPTAPVAVNDNVTTAEDTSLIIGANVTANDTVAASRTLAIDSVSSIPGVTVGTISGTTYTPPADFFGTDFITYVAIDSTGLKSNTATITITVTPVNDPPNAFDDFLSVEEDSIANVLDVLADNGNGPDNAGPSNEVNDSITITGLGPANASTLTTSNGGTVSIASDGKTVIYTPAAGFLGTDTFTYRITDQGGLTDSATVTIDVAPSVLPRARADRASGPENTSVTVDVLANDSINPGSTPEVKSFTQGSFGTVARQSETPSEAGFNILVYTPNDENFYGVDTFTYTMNDSSGLGEDSVGAITITITNVNDPPILVDDIVSGIEDTPTTIAISTLLANDSPGVGEEEGVAQTPQTLTLISVAAVNPAQGSVVIVGSNVIYTPAPDFNGPFLFTYTAQDNGIPPLSGTATVTVNVAAVNDPPIANPDVVNGTEDIPLTISVQTLLANDRPGPETAVDEINQTLSIIGVSPTSAAGGTVSLSGGSVVYTPVADFNGQDTFTYTLSDGAGGTATGVVTVNVAAVNDPPVPGTDFVSGFRDVPITVSAASLLANDSPGPADEANQTLSLISVAATADTNGTVVLSADGLVTYTPNPGFTGSASFEYTVQDSEGASAVGTVNVTVAEFVPSSISGRVWIDDNGDNATNTLERFIGDVWVTLTGSTAQGQPIAPQTRLTLADGSYKFDKLGPGQYTVRYALPQFLRDATNSPDQRTIEISDPRGTNSNANNFAVAGLDLSRLSSTQQAAYQLVISQFASSRNSIPASAPATDVRNLLGGYFAFNGDNTQYFAALPAGAVNILHSEAVLNGDQLLVTVVDTLQHVYTTTLGPKDYVKVQEAGTNNILVGILKVPNAFQLVNRGTPPFSASKYLYSVDEIFAQEGWND